MTELAIVVAIGLVVSAAAIPSITTTVANVRLRSNIGSVSGLLQSCRMLAVNQNKTKTARFSTLSGGSVMAYVKNANDAGALNSSDAQIMMEAPISKVDPPLGAGAPTEISALTLGFTGDHGNPSFTSRGLPCLYDISTGACPTQGFVFYFKDTRQRTAEGWSAVSISPAGRITKWFWNGTTWGN